MLHAKGLAKECPRLQGRLGEKACTQDSAESGGLGAALLYNRQPLK
jgi:hypothetical protein